MRIHTLIRPTRPAGKPQETSNHETSDHETNNEEAATGVASGEEGATLARARSSANQISMTTLVDALAWAAGHESRIDHLRVSIRSGLYTTPTELLSRGMVEFYLLGL